MKALGTDPVDAVSEHWRHVHNRLFVNEKPRPYTRTRHRAWLRRIVRWSVSWVLLITTASAATVLLITMAWRPIPRVVWNSSESVPVGLYHVHTTGKLMVNDIVIAMPPEPLATFLAYGGYLPRGVQLIKRVLALAGQTVCRRGLMIIVDGIEMGTARERDRRGRSLSDWQGCRVLG